MTAYIGYVDNAGQLAHYNLINLIRASCLTEGWTVLRYDTSGTNHELIMMAPGLSGTEEYYIGFKTYHSVASDYYNFVVGSFSGYVAANTFETQPGVLIMGVPAHNQRIDYWLAINGQRIVGALKVGTPVYETFYAGRFNAYALPAQWPYPVAISGMLNDAAATRFSDTAHSMGFKGNRVNLRARNQAGAWVQPAVYPYINSLVANSQRPADSGAANYPLNRLQLAQSGAGIFGDLDGVFHITGFDNAVENTLTIGGVNYVVIQDVWRTGFGDYIAIRMD